MEKVTLNGENIYLQKSELFGWRVIYPIKDENNKINIKHLIAGRTWWNILFVGIIVLLIIGVTFEVASLKELAENCNVLQGIIK